MSIYTNVHKGILSLNSSKFFAGIIMLILNIGSKYITIQFSPSQEAYIKNSIGRQLLIFAIAWMGSRDIYISLGMTAVFIVLTDYLFNETSKYCILSQSFKNINKYIDTNDDGIITQQEMQQAMNILEKHKRSLKK
jgi:hypothetical protein